MNRQADSSASAGAVPARDRFDYSADFEDFEIEPVSESISLTVLTSDAGPIGKAFFLKADGQLDRKTRALSTGRAEVRDINGLDELRTLIQSAEPTQALTFGTLKQGRRTGRVVTQAMLADNADAVARDHQHFAFAEGKPGLMLLDLDADHVSTPLEGLDAIRRTLADVVPALSSASMLYRVSSSSNIYNGPQLLAGTRGQHVILAVRDAADIPRAGKALFDRSWLKGYGRYEVSKSGQLLKRSLIDAAVFQPERLVFVALASCAAPLRQQRSVPVVHGDPHALFDPRLITDLSQDERKALAKIEAQLRAEVEPAAKRQRAAFIESGIDRFVTSCGGTEEEAREALSAAVEGGRLTHNFVLYPEHGEPVTVARILSEPHRWHGRRFADPLEPDYRGDDRIAWLNANTGGRVCLISHAHGGRRYTLHRQRAVIRLEPGETSHAATEALDAIKQAGELFDYGDSSVVRVADGRLITVSDTSLQDYLGSLLMFEKLNGRDKKNESYTRRDPPEKISQFILARRGQRGLRRLEAVITTPTLRRDGSVLSAPGYDAESQLFYYSNALTQPSIPESPSLAEAQEALDFLWWPFRLFQFVGDIACGVQLAALLTAAVRPSLPTAPAFGFDAPMAGSGKTLLADTLAAMAGAYPPETQAPVDDDAEMRKKLFAYVRSGARVIYIDNLTQPIDGSRSSSLCAFLTSSTFSDRILGLSEQASFPNRALLLFTGNNMRVSADMMRRLLIVRIDPRDERPDMRRFAFNPAHMIHRDRPRYVLQHRRRNARSA